MSNTLFVVYITHVFIQCGENPLKKPFKCVEIVLKQTFPLKMAKIAPKLNEVSPKMANSRQKCEIELFDYLKCLYLIPRHFP